MKWFALALAFISGFTGGLALCRWRESISDWRMDAYFAVLGITLAALTLGVSA
jgi:hypothetical protein